MTGPLLELDSVTVRRGMGIVLQDFNLQINRGDCILLSGENGLGKSTIIEAAARLIPLEKDESCTTTLWFVTMKVGE